MEVHSKKKKKKEKRYFQGGTTRTKASFSKTGPVFIVKRWITPLIGPPCKLFTSWGVPLKHECSLRLEIFEVNVQQLGREPANVVCLLEPKELMW